MMTKLTIKLSYCGENYAFEKLYEYSYHNSDQYSLNKLLSTPTPFSHSPDGGVTILTVFDGGKMIRNYTYEGIEGFIRVKDLSYFGKLVEIDYYVLPDLSVKLYYCTENYIFERLYKYSCHNQDRHLIDQTLSIPFPFKKYTSAGTSILSVSDNGIIIGNYTYDGVGGFIRLNELSRFGKLVEVD